MRLEKAIKWFVMGLAILMSCQPSPQEQSTDAVENQLFPLSDTQATFLENLDTSLEPSQIKFALDTALIGHTEILQFCWETADWERKKVLANAICQGNNNYLGEQNPDYWAGILYDLPRFMQFLQEIREPGQQSFMDIGCGNGEKLYAALCTGFSEAYGLEYEEQLVHISKQWLQSLIAKKKVDITLGDALKIDPSYYGQPDFIYMYSPIKDAETMAVLYARVMEGMKIGAYLMEVRMVYSEELKAYTGLQFPKRMGLFVIKKETDGFYFLTYDSYGKEWAKILPEQTPNT